ncbi:MAG TPA: class I SAM-dependent methyltransferase [Acidimicrobiales bacterium]
MDGYDADTYGRGFADVYDDWYGTISDVDATVEGVARLAAEAGGDRVLELGVGTGRLALPLARRGLTVVGIDASAEMLTRLRAKDPEGRVCTVLGDMAAVGEHDIGGPVSVVFAAFNTFFNLTTREAQVACLRGCVTHLTPGGVVAIEAFVPPEPGTTPDSVVSPRTIAADHVVLTVARRDHETQTISGQHIEIRETGIKLRPWMVRYAAPRELDEMAEAAGLVLVRRDADWRGTRFDDTSTSHVSLYRTAAR